MLRTAAGTRYRIATRRVKGSTSAATRFIFVYILGVLFLNIFAAATSYAYDIANIFASFSLLIAAYPMWHFLRDSSKREIIPYFALISLTYGVYYGFSIFTPIDIPTYTEFTTPRRYIVESTMLSCLGIAVMVSGYYFRPVTFRIKELPPISAYWSERRAKVAALVFGLAGLGATTLEIIMLSSQGPNVFGQIVVFGSNLALVAIGILFYLRLRGTLERNYRLALWGLATVFVLVRLSSGSTYPVIQLFLLLFYLYCAERRVFPWRWILAAIIICIPLMASKHDYRGEDWTATTAEVQSLQTAVGGGFGFLGATTERFAKGDWQTYEDSLGIVLGRADLIYMFGYVLEHTPAHIPYLEGETYSNLVWKFIPRALYPDKPEENEANEFGHRYHFINDDDDGTAINLPQMIEMYINFGVPGLVIGMFLLSQLYRFLAYMFNHKYAGEWGTVAAAIIFVNLALIESNFSLVFGNILPFIVFMYLLGFFVRPKGSGRALSMTPKAAKSR